MFFFCGVRAHKFNMRIVTRKKIPIKGIDLDAHNVFFFKNSSTNTLVAAARCAQDMGGNLRIRVRIVATCYSCWLVGEVKL